jgi:putative hemolysin
MFEILVILLLVLTNGVLAMAEIAIVSSRRARLKQLTDEGSAGARAALALSETPSQFLSTVQIGITLVGILAGAFGGASLSAPLAAALANVPLIAPYAQEIAFAAVVLFITYLSLVIGELVPKRLALTNPERAAALLAPPMRLLARVTAPFVHVLTLSTEAIVRLLGIQGGSDQSVTEEEVKIMIDEGTATGVFEPTEREMVTRVFGFTDLSVNALMTPRPDLVTFDITDSEETIRNKLTLHAHSRFPVVNGGIENVLGVVTAQDLLGYCLAGKPMDLQTLMQPPLFVTESMGALELLEKFKAEHCRVAMVMDEYGGIEGMITINHLTEAIVGDVPRARNESASGIEQRPDGTWLVEGRVPNHEFKAKLGIKSLPDEADGAYATVGGFVMNMLGRMPAAGDVFDWDGWRIQVMNMDGLRVDRIEIQRAAP